jgi:uncharacterized protein
LQILYQNILFTIIEKPITKEEIIDPSKIIGLGMNWTDDYLYFDYVLGVINDENTLRAKTNIPVIGGVRFKYKPYLSGRTLTEDLHIDMQRSDGIVSADNVRRLIKTIDTIRK